MQNRLLKKDIVFFSFQVKQQKKILQSTFFYILYNTYIWVALY